MSSQTQTDLDHYISQLRAENAELRQKVDQRRADERCSAKLHAAELADALELAIDIIQRGYPIASAVDQCRTALASYQESQQES